MKPKRRTWRRLWRLLWLLLSLAGSITFGHGQESSKASEVSRAQLQHLRRSYLRYWDELTAQGIVGLERFALTVQRVVETRARIEGEAETGAQMVLDDLVDLFVGSEFVREKVLLMSTPSVLGERALSEDADSLLGFASQFREGEGRFRHFALNAAAAYRAPDSLVALAARVRGGDLFSDSGDSAADIATNRIGREFADLLEEGPLMRLARGDRVSKWIVERFGER